MKRFHGPNRSLGRAFTLIEVLATIMLMAIVLPVVMEGITLSSRAASTARRRTEAAGLAEGKLSEIISTNLWQPGSNISGDFGPDWPDYRWQAAAEPWAMDTTGANIQQITLTVTWVARGRPDSLALSSLAYERTQQ